MICRKCRQLPVGSESECKSAVFLAFLSSTDLANTDMFYCLWNHDMYVKIGRRLAKAIPSYCKSIGFALFGIAMAEGEARFDVGRKVRLENYYPLLGILSLRTYALYHGNKKFLAFLISIYSVCLSLLPHWIFKTNRDTRPCLLPISSLLIFSCALCDVRDPLIRPSL
jgi:hypothetical protein